jgi:hypothetical protein
MGPVINTPYSAQFRADNVAVSFDGNSLVDPSFSTLCTSLQGLQPINNRITISNLGLSGQTVQNMISTATDVDASFVAGKTNYLLIWEITNSIFNAGRTGLQACADMVTYISARLVAHPTWKPIILTCIPRGSNLGGTYTAATGETELQAANTYIRANYLAMGCVAYVETRRTSGPFDFTDSSNLANFPVSLWTDATHPNSAGKAIIAQYISDVLRREITP